MTSKDRTVFWFESCQNKPKETHFWHMVVLVVFGVISGWVWGVINTILGKALQVGFFSVL